MKKKCAMLTKPACLKNIKKLQIYKTILMDRALDHTCSRTQADPTGKIAGK